MSKLFQEIAELMPEKGTVRMALTVKDGKMTVGLVPVFDCDTDSPLVPLSMTGTPEEIDGRFIDAIRDFAPAVQTVGDNLEQARIAAELKAAELKAKTTPKAKGKGKAAPVENLEKRKAAPVDEGQVKTLATVPSGDGNFQTALKGASRATLEAALAAPSLVGITSMKRIAGELSRMREETANALLVPFLTAKVRDATNGVREALGKALEEASGKTLEQLGLAVGQLKLL